MNLIFPLLGPDDIEVKVKKVTEKGAVALLYKTARTDMAMLDETVGPMKWRNSYRDIKGNLFCEISIHDDTIDCWTSKEDCGIESREDGEGNEKKGEASDSFKRAGFRWGIGRELYSAPFIFINCPTKQVNGKFQMANPFEHYSVKAVDYDCDRRIKHLIIVDSKGSVVYTLGRPPQKQSEPIKPDPDQAFLTDGDTVIGPQDHKTLVMLVADETGKKPDQAKLQTMMGILKNLGYAKLSEVKIKDFQQIYTEFNLLVLPEALK